MSAPTFTREGDEYHFDFEDAGVRLTIERIDESDGRLSGHVWARSIHPDRQGLLYWGWHGLDSPRSRADLAKEIAARTPAVSLEAWRDMVLLACIEAGKAYRGATEHVELADVPRRVGLRLLFPGIPLGETTTIFADGETGKSTLGRLLALAVVTGNPMGGFTPSLQGPVMFLDYETNRFEYAEDMLALCRGMGLSEIPRGLHYYEMQRPLAHEIPFLRAELDRTGAVFVFLDSIVAALSGAAKDDDAAKALMNGLRALGPATRLAATHITKEAALPDGIRKVPATAFGSRFFHAYSRSQFQMEKTDEHDDTVNLVLLHKKINRGRKLTPIGLELTFQEGEHPAIVFRRTSPAAAVLTHGTNPERIREALRRGEVDTKKLEEVTGLPAKTLSTTIGRMPDVERVNRMDGSGRGIVAVYRLKEVQHVGHTLDFSRRNVGLSGSPVNGTGREAGDDTGPESFEEQEAVF